MLYNKTFSWETRHTPIHPRQEVQLGEPMTFIGVTYKSMGEKLFTGTEIT